MLVKDDEFHEFHFIFFDLDVGQLLFPQLQCLTISG